jgi:hypothetical protein
MIVEALDRESGLNKRRSLEQEWRGAAIDALFHHLKQRESGRLKAPHVKRARQSRNLKSQMSRSCSFEVARRSPRDNQPRMARAPSGTICQPRHLANINHNLFRPCPFPFPLRQTTKPTCQDGVFRIWKPDLQYVLLSVPLTYPVL